MLLGSGVIEPEGRVEGRVLGGMQEKLALLWKGILAHVSVVLATVWAMQGEKITKREGQNLAPCPGWNSRCDGPLMAVTRLQFQDFTV